MKPKEERMRFKTEFYAFLIIGNVGLMTHNYAQGIAFLVISIVTFVGDLILMIKSDQP